MSVQSRFIYVMYVVGKKSFNFILNRDLLWGSCILLFWSCVPCLWL